MTCWSAQWAGGEVRHRQRWPNGIASCALDCPWGVGRLGQRTVALLQLGASPVSVCHEKGWRMTEIRTPAADGRNDGKEGRKNILAAGGGGAIGRGHGVAGVGQVDE